ncbi:MAG: hypothetical protein ACTSVV_08760 [Promethearchaeota archaeon]
MYKIELEFENYKRLIKDMLDLNNQKKVKELKEKIPEWREYIDSIIKKQKDKLKELTNPQKVSEFERKIENFYDDFFKCFKENKTRESFKYLFSEEITNPIYRKRIYQINHFQGIFNEILERNKIKPIVKLYIFFKLYLDFYETFSIFLTPFLHKMWSTKINPNLKFKNYKAREVFLYLLPNFFYFENLDKYFDYQLRNKLAHCDYFLDPEKNSYIWGVIRNNKTHNEKPDNFEDFLKKCEKTFCLIIWFTTVFDLKINYYFLKEEDEETISYWFKYFDVYATDWLQYHDN